MRTPEGYKPRRFRQWAPDIATLAAEAVAFGDLIVNNSSLRSVAIGLVGLIPSAFKNRRLRKDAQIFEEHSKALEYGIEAVPVLLRHERNRALNRWFKKI